MEQTFAEERSVSIGNGSIQDLASDDDEGGGRRGCSHLLDIVFYRQLRIIIELNE